MARRACNAASLLRPAVGVKDRVAALRRVAADRYDLEPFRARFECADDMRGNPYDVKHSQLDHVVIESDPSGPPDHDVGLLLLLVMVAVRGHPIGCEPEQADPEFLGFDVRPGEARVNRPISERVLDLQQVFDRVIADESSLPSQRQAIEARLDTASVSRNGKDLTPRAADQLPGLRV